jgi:hypothetical protein
MPCRCCSASHWWWIRTAGHVGGPSKPIFSMQRFLNDGGKLLVPLFNIPNNIKVFPPRMMTARTAITAISARVLCGILATGTLEDVAAAVAVTVSVDATVACGARRSTAARARRAWMRESKLAIVGDVVQKGKKGTVVVVERKRVLNEGDVGEGRKGSKKGKPKERALCSTTGQPSD